MYEKNPDKSGSPLAEKNKNEGDATSTISAPQRWNENEKAAESAFLVFPMSESKVESVAQRWSVRNKKKKATSIKKTIFYTQ